MITANKEREARAFVIKDTQAVIDRLLRALPLAIMLAVGILVTIAYFHFKPQPAQVGVQMPARAAPEVAREVRVPVFIEKPLQVYKQIGRAHV